MLGRRPEPGSHQQGSQFVAVQGGGMGLIIQAGPPHVGGGEWSRSSSSTAYL